MTGRGQLLAHLIGDYVLQSHWMATEKTKAHGPAAAHALSYAVPFLALTRNPARLAAIAGTHFVIDRWRLARYVVWAKNQATPTDARYPLDHADSSGYHASLAPYQHEGECTAVSPPPYLAAWLGIIADNTIHGLCNALALREWSP